MSSSSSPSETITSSIESNDVVVFSKTWCGYCAATKALFADLGVEAKVFELDTMGGDGVEIQKELLAMTGQRSVPNVFVKGKHVGGNDDTQAAARTGKLQEMLGLPSAQK